MKLELALLGTEPLLAKLTEAPGTFQREMTKGMSRAMVILQRAAKQNLSGAVLKNRTGTLRRSVNYVVKEVADAVEGATGTNVVYGKTHELGLTIPAHDIVPRTAQALAFSPSGISGGWGNQNIIFARRVHIPAVTMPKRPWLSTAFKSTRSAIFNELQVAGELAARSLAN